MLGLTFDPDVADAPVECRPVATRCRRTRSASLCCKARSTFSSYGPWCLVHNTDRASPAPYKISPSGHSSLITGPSTRRFSASKPEAGSKRSGAPPRQTAVRGSTSSPSPVERSSRDRRGSGGASPRRSDGFWGLPKRSRPETTMTKRSDDDFGDEIEAHLAIEADRLVTEGCAPEDARAEARRAFGNVTAARERFYESARTVWLVQAGQDIRYAVRSFRRTPGFTVAAVLTLALGIGATTAVFSVVNTLLLRPLPYPGAERLVRIVEHIPASESPSGIAITTSSMNHDAFLWWRNETKTMDLTASTDAAATVSMGTTTLRLNGARVSASLFAMLGVRPVLGRLFTQDDERETRVVVLADALWRRLFGADVRIVGRPITLDGQLLTIVGVAPPGVGFPQPNTDFWTPFVVEPDSPTRIMTADVLARLRDGVSLAAASAEANIIGHAFVGDEPQPSEQSSRFQVIGLQDHVVGEFRPALRALMTAVGLVLLIVCMNVANLLLARGAARQYELRIRHAIGAARARIVRQVLTESIVLASAGSIAGIAVAYGGLALLKRLNTIDLPALYGGHRDLLPGLERVTIDSAVLAFASVVCFSTGLA